MAVWDGEIQSSGPTPAVRSVRRSRSRRDGGQAMRSPPTAGASGSRRPGWRRWSIAGPFTGSTPRRAARCSRRSRAPGRSDRLLIVPDRRYLIGAVLGLHPGDRGPGADATGPLWRTASIAVWERRVGGPSGKVDVNADSGYTPLGFAPDT